MKITQTDVLLYFTIFGGDVLTVDDATETPALLNEVIIKFGQDPRAWMSQIATTSTGTEADASDQQSYELRADLGIIKLLGLFVDDRQLMREREYNLPMEWRDSRGDPICYVIDGKSDRFVRLFPRPTRAAVGHTFDALHGSPTVIYTENRTTGIPAQLLLPMTLTLLAREFERESNHRDQDFSGICLALADSYLSMLEIH